jgi:hypothetical protein
MLVSFWWWVFFLSVRKLSARARRTSSLTCANRHEVRFARGPEVITIQRRDTRRPDGYSRDELYWMLHEVRKHEQQQGWKVPE